ncbi:mechanosensitive ion channel family protein [Schleiferia thermophila]|jgi:miniconductance mechanosensitive channel|uniref:Miniconductance mechanosensitive channel n=1 Tax=Schleiferia thermophila TaxID=884107 RepID=A0A369A7P4_9FLAO|nr:mechanosensitive ion channel family protein [Schleiferia thermophila]PMB27816.1 mechanosensitive ion channel protein MscS [Fischerella thermalis CCMEE 5319]RCX05165.1 miniconductance mechanosensitive channel [Schleiferia thermophila]GCD79320.1 membrane protein [Schleiferia thermophila]
MQIAFDEFLKVDDIEFFTDTIARYLRLSPAMEELLILLVDFLLLLLITSLAYVVSKRVLLNLLHRVVKKTDTQFDDLLLEKKVFDGLANLLPAAIAYYSLPLLLRNFPFLTRLTEIAILVFVTIVLIGVINKFLRALEVYFNGIEKYKDKPVKSYLQVVNIINYIGGGIFLIALITGSEPGSIFLKLGALTAVLLLVFKDTILGLVASIQISANELLRIGDWVSVDKYGADGEVIEINLTTVKIRNWDKTITTVPTYAFIADSFKNWRGMQSAGVRRIKRSLFINVNTVKICDEEMLDRFSRYQLIAPYIASKKAEIHQYNEERHIDTSEKINGRQLTNLGIFRQYAMEYIRSKPDIAAEEPIIARHLQPTEHGLPLEIYCFSRLTTLTEYEGLQADIFDHLIAVVKYFDLELFQNPSGADFRALRNY